MSGLEGRMSFPHPQAEVKDEAFEPARIRHPDHDSGMVFFPYPGDSVSDGGRNLPHIIRDRIGIFDEIDNRPEFDIHENRKKLLEYVTEGEKREKFILIMHGVAC